MGVGHLSFIISAYDLSLPFKQLRFEISCHDGSYFLKSVSEGTQGHRVTPSALTAKGGVNIRCEWSWTLLCLILDATYWRLSSEAVTRIPDTMAWVLADVVNTLY